MITFLTHLDINYNQTTYPTIVTIAVPASTNEITSHKSQPNRKLSSQTKYPLTPKFKVLQKNVERHILSFETNKTTSTLIGSASMKRTTPIGSHDFVSTKANSFHLCCIPYPRCPSPGHITRSIAKSNTERSSEAFLFICTRVDIRFGTASGRKFVENFPNKPTCTPFSMVSADTSLYLGTATRLSRTGVVCVGALLACQRLLPRRTMITLQ